MKEIEPKILLTGSTGFVGNGILKGLVDREAPTRAALRKSPTEFPAKVEKAHIGDLNEHQDWTSALISVKVIIHCAARVHVMNETTDDPLEAFRQVNVAGTLSLAQQAAASGVKRFVFLSSIKVNGESTQPGSPYTARNVTNPVDPYGISKQEAEEGLRKISAETGMEHVIIRPVLVYGPGVKANFAQLIKLVAKGIPLPLASTRNKRSLVALDNLLDLITTCIDHPNAANQTFLVSDGRDLSTAELIREISRCLNRKARLLPFPPSLLHIAATLAGKRAVADRLLDSLQVDISHTCETLDWRPPVGLEDALQKTVDSIARR